MPKNIKIGDGCGYMTKKAKTQREIKGEFIVHVDRYAVQNNSFVGCAEDPAFLVAHKSTMDQADGFIRVDEVDFSDGVHLVHDPAVSVVLGIDSYGYGQNSATAWMESKGAIRVRIGKKWHRLIPENGLELLTDAPLKDEVDLSNYEKAKDPTVERTKRLEVG